MRDNPILTVLGRRGRGAVVQALVQDPGPWSVRGLARAAGVSPATAARTVQELAWLGAVDALRPGREAAVTFLPSTPVGHALARLRLPDPRHGACRAFADAYRHHGVSVVRWQAPDDSPADPASPTRIALLCQGEPESALDATGPALDAVVAAGWPPPEVTAWGREALDARDPVAAAILLGQPLG